MRLWAALFLIAAWPAVAAPEQAPRPEPRPGLVTELPVEHPVARQLAETVMQALGYGLEGPFLPEDEALLLAEDALAMLDVTRAVPFDPLPVLGPGLATLPKPLARPEAVEPALLRRSLRPVARPDLAAATIAPRPSGRPEPREVVRATVAPVQPGPLLRYKRRGSVCGDRTIRGEAVSPIVGKLRGCGIADPVRITEVNGVRLTQAALMDCQTAESFKRWIDEGVRPAVGRRGGGLMALRVAAHYVCRTRNHKPGAKISEHGKGRAIDISALILRDGTEITVLEGWRDRRDGKILRAVHQAACGPFGTVLGPEADRYHKDHFHFDTARHRSGAYCR